MQASYIADVSSIGAITEYADGIMKSNGIAKKLRSEYRLIIEEIALRLIGCARTKSELTVTSTKKHGKLRFDFSCPGSTILLTSTDEYDIGGVILEEYSDFLSQSYIGGINTVYFSTSVSGKPFFISTSVAILAGIITALILNSADALDDVTVFSSIMSVFTKFISAIATPVTFLSLSSAIIHLTMSREKNNHLRSLVTRYIVFSVSAVLLGDIFARLQYRLFPLFDLSFYVVDPDSFMGSTFLEFVEHSVPDNLITPLLSDNPLPLLILAVLCGYASVTIFGSEGTALRNGIMSFKALFSRILELVYKTLPFFVYFAMLSGCQHEGLGYFLRIGYLIVVISIAIILFAALYMLALRITGIKFKDFMHDYGSIILDNLKIGSNILALPYNRRSLRRKTSHSRSYLDDGLTLGTIVNMNGSSLLTSFFILYLICSGGIQPEWYVYLSTIAILILLSVGAPNQPGSFLLVSIVLLKHIGVSDALVADALIIEAVFGRTSSFLNSLGDIVSIVIEDRKKKTKSVDSP